jgi:CDP-4-dehydro-6-deoxyglucose reductase, E1
MTSKVPLVRDTLDRDDINKLIEWLQGFPRLTKGELTVQLEKKWSKWLGVKHSVFVNSGSSANLASVYALILSGKMKNKKIVVPAVSWVTTVSPCIQFGLEPILCDCNVENLGLDIDAFKEIVAKESPSAVIIVHVLGVPNDMNEVKKICDDNEIILIEDSCEAIGSEYDGKKVGNFGDISTFSFYFGHHISTIEGGMISTNDEDLYHLLLSLRSHGWDRDLPSHKKEEMRIESGVNDFRALYTFYHPGFNLRSTDLQAFLGIQQMEKLDMVVHRREENFNIYNKLIKNLEWKISPSKEMFVSNFAYPIVTKKIDALISALDANGIECRPLICGSIGRHPFWTKRYGISCCENADYIHDYGIYLPNNHEMTEMEIEFVCEVVNGVLSGGKNDK